MLMSFSEDGASIALKIASNTINGHEPPSLKAQKLFMEQVQLRVGAWKQHVYSLTAGRVFGGPFKGMSITQGALDSCMPAVVLGCYEHELHSIVDKICANGYDTVLNIGCSFGYYATGLALRMPRARIKAFDINADARRKCEEMVAANGVADRVEISGEFRGSDFEHLIQGKTLVLMDIEGAEHGLLDPALWPALCNADVLVEIHELDCPGLTNILKERFVNTHDTEIIDMQTSYFPEVHDLLGHDKYINPFDHLMLGWEGRVGPTPWGWFKAKK